MANVAKPNAPWYAAGGVTELSKAEGRSFARSILESQKYRDDLRKRAETGNLPSQVEVMLWAYAYGKPPDKLEITAGEDLTALSLDQLLEKAQQYQEALRKAQDIENAIDVIDQTSAA